MINVNYAAHYVGDSIKDALEQAMNDYGKDIQFKGRLTFIDGKAELWLVL